MQAALKRIVATPRRGGNVFPLIRLWSPATIDGRRRLASRAAAVAGSDGSQVTLLRILVIGYTLFVANG